MKEFGSSGFINIDKQLKPFLTKGYENITSFNLLKCNTLGVCPILWKSLSDIPTNLSFIGNVSNSTSILILNGENDAQTPVQQAFLLHQKLNEVNYTDHTWITYPDLGHVFYPSSKWKTGIGPIKPNVLAELYSWLVPFKIVNGVLFRFLSDRTMYCHKPSLFSNHLLKWIELHKNMLLGILTCQ